MSGLAVVGFIALVVAGMWLAVYSARFVPDAMTRIGESATAIVSFFSATPKPGITVVPNASTTLPVEVTVPVTAAPATPVPPKPATQDQVASTPAKPGPSTNVTVPMSGTPTTPVIPGPADLIVTVNAVGFLASTTAESFVASSTVPTGSRPAIVFTIKNVGGTPTGVWRFSASIPTQTAFIYQSAPQASLNPGDAIEYTLGFDQANRGADQTISITANFDEAVPESNMDNNSAATKVTVLGS